MYYIMNAAILFDNKSATIEQAARECNNSTILVARRESGYDKFTKLFISGSGHGYEETPVPGAPITSRYTQDTGMGHTNCDKRLLIDNIIIVKDGKIISKGNGIGADEKRRVWVMK